MNVVEQIAVGIREILQDGRSIDKVISFWLKQNKYWSSLEKELFAELIPEIIRWKRLLDMLKTSNAVNFGNTYRDSVFIYLAIHPENILSKEYIDLKTKKRILNAYNDLTLTRAMKESIPDWLDSLGGEELGSVWDNEIHALNDMPKIVLRTNRLKANQSELLKWLLREKYDVVPMEFDAILLQKRANIFKSETFRLGMFEQQDFSSQQVARFLEVEPGMRVIDACAGNGGKTLHMASLMGNKGRIIAMDTADWKLSELKHRVKRAGASIVETRQIDSTKVIKRLFNSADRLLLDVPCSGLGVLRRNPDSKWNLSPEKVEQLKSTQADILNRYSLMVKPNGKLVYSTCSILPSENEMQVHKFIAKMQDQFVLEAEQSISPHKSGFDGFYMARLRREY